MAAAAALVAACAAPAAAQSQAREQDRFKISQMERMLEGAVEHGAAVIRDRLQAALPSEVLISQNARARGFRLEGYGVFFDVAVPSLQGTMPWIFHTLDQNDLGLASALAELRAHVEADGDERLQQALQRVELQVAPVAPADTPPPAPATPATTPVSAASRTAAGSVSATALPGARETAPAATPPAAAPILADPREAFHAEVRDQVVDALLEYASSLGLASGEWITVALRPDDDLPLVAPTADEEFTMTIRAKGADLAAFRTGQITREQAKQRVEVRVF
jgi:hypothetical protein